MVDSILGNVHLPEKWLSHLHLGRAEDWVVIKNASLTELKPLNTAPYFQAASRFYQWMPKTDYAFGLRDLIDAAEYDAFYNKTHGTSVLVTSIYRVKPVKKGEEEVMIRNFDHIPVRLYRGQVPFLDNFALPSLLVDPDLKAPVYMAVINPKPGRESADELSAVG